MKQPQQQSQPQQQEQKKSIMTNEQQIAITRMAIVIETYGVLAELKAVPSDNLTLTTLQQQGELMCRWANALAYDLTPPEKLEANSDKVCVGRMTELAMSADSNANKAKKISPGDWCTKLIGPKKKTLPEIIKNLYDWSVLLNQELDLKVQS